MGKIQIKNAFNINEKKFCRYCGKRLRLKNKTGTCSKEHEDAQRVRSYLKTVFR